MTPSADPTPSMPGKHGAELQASILFVDDDPLILKSMRRLFSEHYLVQTAQSGQEALALLAKGPQLIPISAANRKLNRKTALGGKSGKGEVLYYGAVNPGNAAECLTRYLHEFGLGLPVALNKRALVLVFHRDK